MSGGTGIRTPDPLHAMQVLYQLSYTPKGIAMLPVEESGLRFDLWERARIEMALLQSVTEQV